jgi:pilus assembly protein CpaF
MSFELILPFFPEELRALLLDPSISDLMINGTTGVYADRGGVVEQITLSAPYSNDRLQAAIERVARILGQDLTTQNPILNTRLPDGSRVAVVGTPSSINGPTFTVRKFNRWFTSEELIASGSLPEEIRDSVVSFIAERKNGIISGGTGSGKTTLMKALLDHVPMQERLIVIEQPAELKITHPNAVRWEAVEAIPGQVAVTPSQLLAAALRHRPDRIIMGEIRDQCGYDLLQAMNTGHGGTLSTIHAKSAWDALTRLSDLALSARPNLNHSFIRSETAEAIDFVLYCERDPAGRRHEDGQLGQSVFRRLVTGGNEDFGIEVGIVVAGDFAQLQSVFVAVVRDDMHVGRAVRQFGLDADKARCNVSTIEHPIHGVTCKHVGNLLLIWKQDECRLEQSGADHRRRVCLGHGDGAWRVWLEMLSVWSAGARGKGSGGSKCKPTGNEDEDRWFHGSLFLSVMQTRPGRTA